MILDSIFDSYRIATDANGKRSPSASKTITSGSCYVQPASAERRAVTGMDLSVQVYEMITEETNFEDSDKIVIESVAYFIFGYEVKEVNGQQLTYVMLYIKKL